MPDLDWNKAVWGGAAAWPDAGEQWSAPWGGSRAQWLGCLLPRLAACLPARRVLEIAPGFGRWTQYLLPQCEAYLGVDLAGNCVAACEARFASAPHAHFVQNDGRALPIDTEAPWDLVFSFDSLVHAEFDVVAHYIAQIVPALAAGGRAFIHHSNQGACLPGSPNPHQRGTDVSAARVREAVQHAGGAVLVQEIVHWRGQLPNDCFTFFARGPVATAPVVFENPLLMVEADLIRQTHVPYQRPGAC